MKRSIVLLSLFAAVLFACKRNKKQMLTGTWRAVKVENPAMDSFFAKSKRMIDTMGGSKDPAVNMQLYGVVNVDSLRQVMKREYDSVTTLQYGSVSNTVYRFRKDSIAVITFGGITDSSRWYLDEKGALVLEELTGTDKISMDVIALTDTLLKLRFAAEEDTSVVTFRAEQ